MLVMTVKDEESGSRIKILSNICHALRVMNYQKSLVASAVALADKFDTLTGIFGIGQAPKGTQTHLHYVVQH